MKYTGANIRLLKQPSLADIRITLELIRLYGGNSLAINTFHYAYLEGATLARPPAGWYPQGLIWPDVGQDPYHPYSDTVSVDVVRATAEMALGMGFERVVLKPMIDPHARGGWRGFIQVPVGLRREFLSDYKNKLLAPYLPMVKELGLDLCIGTEMVQVTKDCGPAFWINVVKWLRSKGVKQRLTYAANWGWELDSEFRRLKDLWPYVDYCGIDAYWPMVNEEYTGPITKELLLNGREQNVGWSRKLAVNGVPQSWCWPIDLDLRTFLQTTGKPLWFTEVGYPNNLTAAHDPAGDTPSQEQTFALSLPLWQATREKWDGVLEGWLAWEAGHGSVVSTTHNILSDTLGRVVLGRGGE